MIHYKGHKLFEELNRNEKPTGGPRTKEGRAFIVLKYRKEERKK
jgi:hypothetical protein